MFILVVLRNSIHLMQQNGDIFFRLVVFFLVIIMRMKLFVESFIKNVSS